MPSELNNFSFTHHRSRSFCTGNNLFTPSPSKCQIRGETPRTENVTTYWLVGHIENLGWYVWSIGELIYWGNRSIRKTYLSIALSTANSTWAALGMNPGF
jgi:hypothetical protein